jgi:hypothetical protein
MSRLPHFLDNWLIDGGEVVSIMRRPPFTPRKILDSFLLEMGHSAAERIRLIEKSNNLIGNPEEVNKQKQR